MTYRFKARLSSEWVLEKPSGTVLPLSDVLRLLEAVDATGHIAGACKACGLSYRHGWGILRHAEKEFEVALIETSRRQGSKLTSFAQHLIWANRRVDARLTPTLESMASELQEELERLYPESQPRLRLHASHGFAVEGLMQLANGMDMLPLELRYRTAIEALASLDRAECDLAGFQVPVGEFELPILQRYSEWFDADRHVLIHLAVRNTGMFVKPDNPKGITSIADLVRGDVRFVNRQIGSSTRYLVELMLGQLDIDPSLIQGYDNSEFTHMAIAAHIASGMADVGIGVETAAWRCGLAFIPLAQERYFFAANRDNLDTPQMKRLLNLMNGEQYQAYVSQLVGYDATLLGEVQTLEEAFGAEFVSLLKTDA
ncbi:substrate-binding domain-containing protein [Allopusillimonas ginsengisoli]|uniref:helix-turn-helix transcriptional regulator n=1 Tax=Allopusillimonas ginsengisoli TaxID=453575 RepID=UPI00101FEF6B|nr:substrate-binding domain-containing protein [Allopusillimonas ginsengisoli]TEA77496.1 LysR family transcriptional regulator [Allopusillimonas ginsengisoli]